ncbi:MAG: hypothetical protein D6731_21270 [Planctomycetota bacterium]|nr:MAG: hypothetical protein D6731_21270 [Planctomycetota bacterium]
MSEAESSESSGAREDAGDAQAPSGPARRDADAVDLVRRRLLLAGGRYAAPAVLASLGLSGAAFAQGASCPPTRNRCPPLRICAPSRRCRPGGGGS